MKKDFKIGEVVAIEVLEKVGVVEKKFIFKGFVCWLVRYAVDIDLQNEGMPPTTVGLYDAYELASTEGRSKLIRETV